ESVEAPALEPFSSHMAQLDAGALQCTLRVLKMNGSTMLFINDKEMERLDELAVAMPARPPSQDIVSATFMGDHGQSDSLVLASKLSKRYGRQFYVSMNLQLDLMTRPLFEKALISHMQQQAKFFV
ncbi:CG13319, partial [Drosophila busckii]